MKIIAMKPTINNQQPLCVNQKRLRPLLLYWPLQQVSHWRMHSLSRSIRALLAIRGGLLASANEVITNNRYTAGIIFLLVIAPLSSIFYQLFSSASVFTHWYYVNWYYFFYTLSPYLMLLFASVGTFLLFPVKCKTSYLATVWPAGYAIAKIIYLGIFVSTNEQFHSAAPWFLFITGILAAVGFMYSADYLLYRRYHLKAGTIARMVGIIKAPGISAGDKMRLLENQSLELENFNQRY